MRRNRDGNGDGNSKLSQFGIEVEAYEQAERKKEEVTRKIVQVLERNHSAWGDDNILVWDFYQMFERGRMKVTFAQFEAMRNLTRPESIVRIRRFINKDGVLQKDGSRKYYLPTENTTSKRRAMAGRVERVMVGAGI